MYIFIAIYIIVALYLVTTPMYLSKELVSEFKNSEEYIQEQKDSENIKLITIVVKYIEKNPLFTRSLIAIFWPLILLFHIIL